MTIDYDHTLNIHTVGGATAALSTIFPASVPNSVLDVGCGAGTWMRAAIDVGVKTVRGIDGIIVPGNALLVERAVVEQRDLTKPFDLGTRFELALCLEVAEHLPPIAAAGLIASIVEHADTVLYSAACPDQFGQHHVNCQWPSYWQALFNRHGFVCDDSARWEIWNDTRIEPWYRQNIFVARRDPANAGGEPRIRSVVHPDMVHLLCLGRSRARTPRKSPIWRRVAHRLLPRRHKQ